MKQNLNTYFSENFLGGRPLNKDMRKYFDMLIRTYEEELLISFLKSKKSYLADRKYEDETHLLNTIRSTISKGIAAYENRYKKRMKYFKTMPPRSSIYMPDYEPEKKKVKKYNLF